jgi:hypothetical protein
MKDLSYIINLFLLNVSYVGSVGQYENIAQLILTFGFLFVN